MKMQLYPFNCDSVMPVEGTALKTKTSGDPVEQTSSPSLVSAQYVVLSCSSTRYLSAIKDFTTPTKS